jgi:predicted pyridoxine 5'-phosphate oxidase superfamily flavin-nucleotide-binding protein
MAVLTDAMVRLVREQRLGFVASISPDGFPKVSPKGSLRVWDAENLAFADVDSPNTVRNLAKNPRTEINVVDPLTRKGFRFTGTATVLHAGDLYFKVLDEYKSEGADVRRVRSIVVVRVTNATPLTSPAYAMGFREEEVRRLWEEYYRKASQRTVLDITPPNDF